MITTADAGYFTPARTSPIRPLVFVIDDDVAVRELLELVIEASGREVQTYASGQEFLARPRPWARVAWFSTSPSPTSTASIDRSVWLSWPPISSRRVSPPGPPR